MPDLEVDIQYLLPDRNREVVCMYRNDQWGR